MPDALRFCIALLLLLLGGGLLAPSLQAQDIPVPDEPLAGLEPGTDEPVDRIAAVVGDSIILHSQILQRLAQLQSQGVQLPASPEELREVERQILEAELIPQQLVLQAAAEDTLFAVEEEEVAFYFQDSWMQQLEEFGGEAGLEEALAETGMSLAGYRAELRDNIERQLTLDRYLEYRRDQARPVVVDQAEVEAFFERERAQLQNRPATIRFRQAFVEPRPTEEAMAEAVAEAERIMERVQSGEDFANLARQFSDDPGSRQEGGDLGWVRRGASDLDLEFEDAAFSLREGQVAGPVETQFGAHIIKVERIRSGERRVRHILVAAPGDREAARERALRFRDQVADGSASIRDFPTQTSEAIGDELELPMDQIQESLPSSYANALREAQPGDVLGPLELTLDDERSVFAIVEVMERRDAGEFTLEDAEDWIRQQIRNQRFQERLLRQLEDRTHIEIRL